MKKFLFLALVMVTTWAGATPPGGAVIFVQQNMAFYWPTNGIGTMTYSLSGVTVGQTAPTNSAPSPAALKLALAGGDIWASPYIVTTNDTWLLAGKMADDGTNLNVTVNFTCLATNVVTGFTVTNVTMATNTFYGYVYGDATPIPVLVSNRFLSALMPAYDAYGAAQATTNGYPWLTASSNAWSLAVATNGMNSGDFRGPINSNGLAWVNVYMSNGVVRFKQIAP